MGGIWKKWENVGEVCWGVGEVRRKMLGMCEGGVRKDVG